MPLVSKIAVVIQKVANGWSCELLYYETEQLNSLLDIKLNLNCCGLAKFTIQYEPM